MLFSYLSKAPEKLSMQRKTTQRSISHPSKQFNSTALADDIRIHYQAGTPKRIAKPVIQKRDNKQSQAYFSSVSKSEILRSSINKKSRIIQRFIDPERISYWCSIDKGAMSNLLNNANTPVFYGQRPISGASCGGHVFLTGFSPYYSPCYLVDMTDWTNYLAKDGSTVNLLQDPNTGKTVTRMHVINGKFFGPSLPINMILGTQEDNHKHLISAEQYIRKFFNKSANKLKSGDQPIGVMYTVIPTNFHKPRFTSNYLNYVRNVDYFDYIFWLNDAFPQNLHCTATFYICDQKGRCWYSPEQFESIPINEY